MRRGAARPLLSPRKPATGRPAKDHRTVVNAILWRPRTGARGATRRRGTARGRGRTPAPAARACYGFWGRPKRTTSVFPRTRSGIAASTAPSARGPKSAASRGPVLAAPDAPSAPEGSARPSESHTRLEQRASVWDRAPARCRRGATPAGRWTRPSPGVGASGGPSSTSGPSGAASRSPGSRPGASGASSTPCRRWRCPCAVVRRLG